MIDTIGFDELNNEGFKLKIVDHNDIISAISKSFEDAELIKDIMDFVEGGAAKAIKNDLTANIPHIGCVRRNTAMMAIREKGTELKEARTKMTKFEYKIKVRSIVAEHNIVKQEVDRERMRLLRTKRRYRSQYDWMYLNISKAYADFFITSRLGFKYIEFDQRVQDAYDRLNQL